MHDPLTQAFQIKYPWRKWGKRGTTDFERSYREGFITIWHKDPEKDGSDDSCGWFKRARHGDEEILQKIVKRYESEWDSEHSGLFDKEGNPKLSVIGTVNNLVWYAAFEHFSDRDKANAFMQNNLFEIQFFAENTVDSLFSNITQKYGKECREYRIRSLASIIYAWILRHEQKWWQHPKWHIHHWRFQVHPWQSVKRRYWDKCCICGKRGFKGQAMGDWSGKRIWHTTCNRRPITMENI